MKTELNAVIEDFRNESPEFRRFFRRHPIAGRIIVRRALHNLKQGPPQGVPNIEAITATTEVEVKRSVLTSIILGVIVKLAVEYIYNWIKKQQER